MFGGKFKHNPANIQKMKEENCTFAHVGVQSGSLGPDLIKFIKNF